MTALQTMWIASLVAEVAFFMAGWFAAYRRRSAAEKRAAREREAAAESAEIDSLRGELQQTRVELASATARAKEAQESAATALAEQQRTMQASVEAERERLRAAAIEHRTALSTAEAKANKASEDLRIVRIDCDRRISEAAAAHRTELSGLRDKLSAEQALLRTARAEAEQASKRADESDRAASVARSDLVEVTSQLELVSEKLRSATAQADGMRVRAAEVAEGRQRIMSLIDQLEQRERRVALLTGQVTDLQELNDALRAELGEAVRHQDRVAELSELADERQELAVQVEVLRNKVADVELLRSENAELRAAAAAAEPLRAELQALMEELAAARARLFAEDSPAHRPLASGERPTGLVGTGAALQEMLDRIAGQSGMRAAVLADELGLPLVGFGEEPNELAAFAGYLSDIAAKAGGFLPFGRLRRLTITDENTTTLSVFPYYAPNSQIALVTLTVGSLPNSGKIAEVLRGAAHIIQ